MDNEMLLGRQSYKEDVRISNKTIKSMTPKTGVN